jgi:hypothetical protein
MTSADDPRIELQNDFQPMEWMKKGFKELLVAVAPGEDWGNQYKLDFMMQALMEASLHSLGESPQKTPGNTSQDGIKNALRTFWVTLA